MRTAERISALNSWDPTRRNHYEEQTIKTREDILPQHDGKNQPLNGNKCGFSALKMRVPEFYRKKANRHKHPHSIEEAIRVIRLMTSWIFASIKKKREIFRSIDPHPDKIASYKKCLGYFENEKIRALFYHIDKLTKKGHRKRRKEGIESIVLFTLACLFNYVDLITMGIGIRHSRHVFDYKGYDFLAAKIGTTKSRIMRAIKVLKKLGLVEVVNILGTTDDGKIITKHTKITLHSEAFNMLGLSEQYYKDKEYAYDKWIGKEEAISLKTKKREIEKELKVQRKIDETRAKLNKNQSKYSTNERNQYKKRDITSPNYPDYTGCASDRSLKIKQQQRTPMPTPLKDWLSKFKPPK